MFVHYERCWPGGVQVLEGDLKHSTSSRPVIGTGRDRFFANRSFAELALSECKRKRDGLRPVLQKPAGVRDGCAGPAFGPALGEAAGQSLALVGFEGKEQKA